MKEKEWTDEEILNYMKSAVAKISKDTITVGTIKKAIRLLRGYKVPEPYYVEVENPIERGDFLYRDSVGTEELHEEDE